MTIMSPSKLGAWLMRPEGVAAPAPVAPAVVEDAAAQERELNNLARYALHGEVLHADLVKVIGLIRQVAVLPATLVPLEQVVVPKQALLSFTQVITQAEGIARTLGAAVAAAKAVVIAEPPASFADAHEAFTALDGAMADGRRGKVAVGESGQAFVAALRARHEQYQRFMAEGVGA